MQRAFATLPADMQARLTKLTVHHGLAGFGDRYVRITGQPFPELEDASPKTPLPSVTHPAIIRNPDTGTCSLFVNPGFTIKFADMSDDDSQSLLDTLYRHATAPQNIYRHRWQPDDIVIWDNFATMHMATGGYAAPMRRIMHRITVGGPIVEAAKAA
jgi:taurine dioxygenase